MRAAPRAGPRGVVASRPVEIVLSALDRLTRMPILAGFSMLCAVLVAVAGVRYLYDLESPLAPAGDRVVIGDFLAFYTGAEMIAAGRGRELYDLDPQHELQDRLAGKALVEWQPYVNPPLLALAVRPLVGMGVIRAFRAYGAAMAVAGLLGAAALVGLVPALSRTPLGAATVVLLALSFHPLARTMFGGQNSVLTWTLLTGAGWALQRRREALAGTLLGLLSYKPQYLPFPVLVLAWARAWSAVAAAAVVVTLHYALGAAVAGADWPLRFSEALVRYRPMEWSESLDTHFSLLPFFDYSVGGVGGLALGGSAIVGVIAALWNFAPRARPGSGAFPLLWSLAIVAEMLSSPHLQYYDFAVLVLPVAIGFDRMVAAGHDPPLVLRVVAAIGYVGYPWFATAGASLGFQPLTIWMVAIYAWLCWVARTAGSAVEGGAGRASA